MDIFFSAQNFVSTMAFLTHVFHILVHGSRVDQTRAGTGEIESTVRKAVNKSNPGQKYTVMDFVANVAQEEPIKAQN